MATYTRAHQAILWFLAECSLARTVDGERCHISGVERCFDIKRPAEVGTLVAVQCCRAPHKYAFGFLRGIGANSHGLRWLVENIIDREECWVWNVQVIGLPLKTTELHPEWHWTDAQFEVDDRWRRVGYRSKNHTYASRQVRWHDKRCAELVIGKRFTSEVVKKKLFHRKDMTPANMKRFWEESIADWPNLCVEDPMYFPKKAVTE